MELVILAAVGLTGYGITKNNRRPAVSSIPYKSQTDPHGIGYGPDNAVRNNAICKANKAFLSKDFRDSKDPARTGVIAPGPFYRSDKAQATSAAYKQDRMELFTGQLENCRSKTGTFQHKRESGPMFAPALSRTPVTSSGRQAYVDFRGAQDADRYQVGMKHHGCGPVDPIRVGPGLGLDPSVPAAGGFQQFERIMPENVNGYRKNSLPGRINPGAAPVQGGANMGQMNFKGLKPTWDINRLPPVPGKCHVNAAGIHGLQPVGHRQDDTEGFVGHAYGGIVAPAPGASSMSLNVRRADDKHGCILNAVGQGIQAGGYNTHQQSDPGQFRQSLGPLPTGPITGAACGGFQTANVTVAPTQREQGGFATNIGATQTGAAYRAARSTRAVTGRETLASQPLVGSAHGPHAQAPGAMTARERRPDTCVGYMPNGSTQNMFMADVTSARLRNPVNAAHVNAGGMQTVNYGMPGSDQRCMNKLPINNQLDLGLAKDILNSNPYTHPIF